jgi:hypothetical protein
MYGRDGPSRQIQVEDRRHDRSRGGLAHATGGRRKTAFRPNPPLVSAALRLHLLTEPIDRRLGATPAVRNVQCCQRHLHNTQCAKDHWRIDVSYMGDAEPLAGELADAVAQNHAALLVAVCAYRVRVVAIGQQRRDGVAALNRFDDVEADDSALRPNADGASHCLGQQPVAPEYVLRPSSNSRSSA